MFVWIKDVGNIIRVRMTGEMTEDQKLWKQNVMAQSSGVEESPAQQRTSVPGVGVCRTSVHQKEQDVPHSWGTLKHFRVSQAVLRAKIVKWNTGFQQSHRSTCKEIR